ncbi:MAG: hypothetical protein PHX27_01290 [Candidatus ainarchaeum sp.]|nr:hypothetical protein [Candidatus ainarchaeum sp.]
MKKIILFLLILTFFLGCVSENNSSIEKDFLELKEEYFVLNSFNPNENIMNSYLNEISLLRSNSPTYFNNILDVEIASSQSFLYFSKALDESKKINYFSNHCNSIDYKNTINYLNLSIKYSNKAKSIILLPNEIQFLRENQLETINGINLFSKELLESIKDTC